MSKEHGTITSQKAVPEAPWKVPPPPDPLSAIKAGALAFLRSQQEPLYALVDGARSDRILELLRQHAEPAGLPDPPVRSTDSSHLSATIYQSLHLTAKIAEIGEHGPYIVQLTTNNGLLPELIAEGWGQSWGYFLTSPAPFNEVRNHFRHFLLVRHPDGDSIVFRFFDPRVLRPFLPVCTQGEIAQFFGPMTSFVCEEERGRGLLQWTASDGKLSLLQPLVATAS